jgi:hypothetical protein
MPNATTVLKFRRLLERHQLAEQLLAGRLLQANSVKLKTDTIVDATITGGCLARLRMTISRTTLICIRPAKVSNGTLA